MKVEADEGLSVTIDGGVARVGWQRHDDWFGPATVPDHPDVECTVRAVGDQPAVVFRIEARRDLTGWATGTFAEPRVGWPHFRPAERTSGGLPEGANAFGFQ